MDCGTAEELRRATQRLFRRFGALAGDTTPCGKPLPMAHAHALMLLLGRGELSQQELGAELCIDKSNVARMCARMVDAGHASQRPCPQDGRSRRVTLTARGKRLAAEVDLASRARFEALLAAVGENRSSQVVAALQELVVALDALVSARPQESHPG